MKSVKFAVVTLLGLAVSGAALAGGNNKVVVSGASSKGGASAFAIDVVSSGNAAAVSLVVTLPGASEKTVDLSSCTAKLPKGWQAVCVMKGETVRIGAFAGLGAAPMAAGLASIGEIRVTKQLAGEVSLSEVELGDASGAVLSNASDVSVQ